MNQALSGSISGSLSQPNVPAAITAFNTTHTLSGSPNAAGQFIIQGVPAGTYTLHAVPAAPHSSVSVSPVNVSTGVTTTVGVLSI